MATDSRAIIYEGESRSGLLDVHKLFMLSPHAAIVTGGAGYGVLLCERFEAHVRKARLWDFEDIVDAALPFFHGELSRIEGEGALSPGEPTGKVSSGSPVLDRLYFVIAGRRREEDEPFRFVFFASEAPSDPLHEVRTGRVLAVPRQMGIEYRLGRLPEEEESLDTAEALCSALLWKLAGVGDEVGPPFYFARITEQGVSLRTEVEAHSP